MGDDLLESHPIMTRYICYYKKLKDVHLLYYKFYTNVILSLGIAPFFTIAISRQLSVTAHKEIYGDYTPPKKESKELIKMTTEVTMRDARNTELIKKSGVIEGQKPYRAPIYDNYYQTIKGLYRQGILGFYKGNFLRLCFFLISQRVKISLDWFIRERKEYSFNNILRDFLTLNICEILFHPMFVAENRFILQNRLPTFRVYQNFARFRSRSMLDLYTGSLGHIPKNFITLLGMYIYYLMPTSGNFFYGYLIGTTLSYPYMTAFRRIVSQSSQLPGLIPLRYLNVFHAFFLIRREEGIFRGLYKGYLSYMIGSAIWILYVPSIAENIYRLKKAEEEEVLFVNDPIFNEIQKRKFSQLKGDE